jgi:hypothetical protein
MPQVYPTIKHYNAVHDEKEKMQQHLHKGLNKFLTSSKIGGDIMDIYPMITNIEVYDLEELIGSIVLRIYVDDSEMTSKNMYEKGLDPHYLIDHHLAKYLPYFSVPKSTKIGFVVIGPDGKTIDSSLG